MSQIASEYRIFGQNPPKKEENYMSQGDFLALFHAFYFSQDKKWVHAGEFAKHLHELNSSEVYKKLLNAANTSHIRKTRKVAEKIGNPPVYAFRSKAEWVPMNENYYILMDFLDKNREKGATPAEIQSNLRKNHPKKLSGFKPTGALAHGRRLGVFDKFNNTHWKLTDFGLKVLQNWSKYSPECRIMPKKQVKKAKNTQKQAIFGKKEEKVLVLRKKHVSALFLIYLVDSSTHNGIWRFYELHRAFFSENGLEMANGQSLGGILGYLKGKDLVVLAPSVSKVYEWCLTAKGVNYLENTPEFNVLDGNFSKYCLKSLKKPSKSVKNEQKSLNLGQNQAEFSENLEKITKNLPQPKPHISGEIEQKINKLLKNRGEIDGLIDITKLTPIREKIPSLTPKTAENSSKLPNFPLKSAKNDPNEGFFNLKYPKKSKKSVSPKKYMTQAQKAILYSSAGILGVFALGTGFGWYFRGKMG